MASRDSHSSWIKFPKAGHDPLQRAILGLLFAVSSLVAMQSPLELAPGIILDSRTVLVALAGYLFGWPAVVTVLVPVVSYRIYLGGEGTFSGCVTIITEAMLGALFYTFRDKVFPKHPMLRLGFFGVWVSLLAVCCSLLLPWERAKVLIVDTSIPLIILYSLGVLFIGGLFLREKARQEHERLLRLMEHSLESIKDAAYWVRPEDGQVLYVNQAACDTLGYTREEMYRLKIWDLDPSVTKARWNQNYTNLKRGTRPTMETINRRRDGEIVPVEVSISRVEVDGVDYVCGISRDISERQQTEADKEKLEAELRQAQKMEAIGRLAGGVAHDFNNMLLIILANAQSLLDRSLEKDSIGHKLQQIVDAAERSADLTRGLLGFARKQAIQPQKLDINKSVEDILKMLDRLIGKQVAVHYRLGENVWSVYMDPSQVNQIITNLCLNARDAIDGNGTITISTSNRVVSTKDCEFIPNAKPGHYVVVCVQDDGCGMTPETAKSIFEPFFTTKPTGEGTGLGLATVHGIAYQNGGFVTVESEPGKGSLFNVYLPGHETAMEASPSLPESKNSPSKQATILFVEDEQAILELSATALRRQGHHVLEAHNGQLATKKARENAGRIDLLITDINMPDTLGTDLACQIAKIIPGLTCLFISGNPSEALLNQADPNIHASHVLRKPYKPSELTDEVASILSTMAKKPSR